MRKKRLTLNTTSSLLLEVAAIISGLILPRLIMAAYGSEVNGLVNSITQFLSIISFLELGVGSVVQSSLYGPLARKDHVVISRIFVSAQKFFRKIAYILLVYVVALMIFYPFIADQDFGWMYTALLIAAMSISSFAQYYFGVVNRLLLSADQRGYVQFTAQIVTLILNVIASVILIRMGVSIQMVKLVTSIIYLGRPLFLRWYVNRHYAIDRKITYTEEPISQKWNGVAQHVAAVVLDGTDTIVLTIFSTLSNVSIYSVYNMVVYGIKRLFMSLTNGIQALLGELWAKKEMDTLRNTFSWFEWLMHTGVTFIFGCAGVLIVPFVAVYTMGINDANYIQPVFAALITIANAAHCLRLPYNVMIIAVGHYKQTQNNYIIAMVLNIGISVVAAIWLGLIGVAIGTLVAMAYQTVWMARYNSKNLIPGTLKSFVKQIFVDAGTVLVGVAATLMLSLNGISVTSWIILAVKVVLIWFVIMCLINLIFYRDKMKRAAIRVRDFISRKDKREKM